MILRAIIGFLTVWSVVYVLLHHTVHSTLQQKWTAIKCLAVSGITATLAAVVLFFFVQIF